MKKYIRHIMDIGTIFNWYAIDGGRKISTCIVVRGPSPESELGIHTIYRFDYGDFHPYMPHGNEEILA